MKNFAKVDSAPDASGHIGYLDAVSALEVIAGLKKRTVDLLLPRAGDRMLEVGCGNGDEARAIAARVAPGGSVVAIDSSAKMIDEARRRGSEGVTFEQMDAHDLRFPDDGFDGCRVERVLQHVDDPARVVREMARVLRRGRRLVAVEPDWETLNVSATDSALSRRIIEHQAESPSHRHGRIGRRLPQLLVDAGLDVPFVEAAIFVTREFELADRIGGLSDAAAGARDAGVVTAAQAAGWIAELVDQGRRGTLVGSLSAYIVAGEKG